MIEAVQTFVQAAKAQAHVQTLISKADLSVHFITDEEMVSLCFRNGEIAIEPGRIAMDNSYQIVAPAAELRELLQGQVKLRSLKGVKALTVKAPFRTLLLLESIFYLVQPKKSIDLGSGNRIKSF